MQNRDFMYVFHFDYQALKILKGFVKLSAAPDVWYDIWP